MSTNGAVEQEIQAKGLTAPRVTQADIEAEITGEHYFTALDGVLTGAPVDSASAGPLSRLTFCVLVLKNGFTVTGESACVSPENFDAAVGRKIARLNAVNKLWPLLGFRLAYAVAEAAKPPRVIYRCAKSGEIVSQAYAEANPDTTVKETRR